MRIVESTVSRPVLLTVGFFLSLLAFPNISFAQNPLFVEKTGANNPLLGLDVGTRSTPVFVDIDLDGDRDAFAGGADGKFKYYRRSGTLAVPIFTEILGINNPLNSFDVGSNSAPAFADMDADGDFDMISGEFSGVFFYFENTGTVAAPAFTQRTGLNNPLDGIAYGFDVGSSSTPALADFDGDGDFDCISGESLGTFKYFENIGTDLAPQFGEVTGSGNPFNGFDAGFNSAPAVVDINSDGDLDVFSGSSTGVFKCYQNDGTVIAPSFNEQLIAPFPPFLNNPLRPDATFDKGSNTTPYFVDMDNDTDMDVVAGENAGVFFYFENQASTCQPVITCTANLTVQLDNDQPSADGVRTLTQGEYVLTASQGCGNTLTHPVQITLSGNIYDCMDIGTPQTALAVIRDRYNGFVRRCSTNVVVRDQIAPNAVCISGAFEVLLDENGQAIAPSPSDLDNGSTDNCDNDPLNFSFVTAPSSTFDCEDVGPLTVWLRVTDAYGNSSSCSAQVTVTDDMPPVVATEGGDQDEQTIGNCYGEELDMSDLTLPVVNDNCSPIVATTFTLDEITTQADDVETYIINWTFTDDNDNSTEFAQLLHVVDNIPPTLSCPANISVTTNPLIEECGEYVDFNLPTTSDCNYDPSRLIYSASPGDLFPVGKTIVSFVAYDTDDNSATCAFTITVEDDDPPFMNFCFDGELNEDLTPENLTVNADVNSCSAEVWVQIPYLYDNCDGAPYLTIEFDNQGVYFIEAGVDIPSCDATLSKYSFPIGTTTVTITASDNSGNEVSISYLVTVTDAQAPTLVCPDFITVSNAPGQCAQNVPLGLPEASDLCAGQVSVIRVEPNAPFLQQVSGNSFPVGTTVVAYKATDGAGNTSTCTYEVQVMDNEAPTISCPALVTVTAVSNSCTATATWTVTASDNCSGVTTTPSHTPGSTFNEGVTTVNYTATDAVGRTATCSFAVNVYNNVPPTISCPLNTTISLLGSVCYGTYIGNNATPAAGSGCNAGVVTYYNGLSLITLGSYQFPLGATTVTARTTDFSGSTATCTFNVTVQDITSPTITGAVCNTTITQTAGPNCSALANWIEPTATDNCTAQPARTRTHAPNASFPVGTTTVIYTFTDGSNNTSICNFQVVVRDLTPPTITCPANQTVNATQGLCTGTATWNNPSASDACSSYTLVVSNTAGSSVSTSTSTSSATFPKGTTTVTYTATDGSPASNNTACSFTVTVVDNQNPVLTNCPNSATYTDISDNDCVLAVNWTPPSAADNCPGVVLTSTHQPGINFSDGTTTTVTYTATDAVGNTAKCSFSITVLDNTNPTITCPANITVAATSQNCSATVNNLGTPNAADNCAPYLSLTNNAPVNATYAGPGSTTVIWTVLDRSNRTATCAQTVTVTGSGNPSLTCPANVTVTTVQNSCAASNVVLGTPTPSNGACGGGTPVGQATNNGPNTYATGTTTVTWNANFTGGGTASCTQTVTVNDGQNPVITCPANATVNAGAGTCVYSGSLGSATTSDNCGVLGTTLFPAGPYAVGPNSITYTVSDLSGRTATCVQSLRVVDNHNPVITCPSNTTVSANQNNCTTFIGTTGSAATSDNCGIQGTAVTPASPYPVGNTTLTYTTTDINGRTATCTQVVTVTGSTPTLSCPANQTVSATANCSVPTGSVTLGSPTAGGCATQSGNPTNNAPNSYQLGLTTVTWTATFVGNSTASCSQTITVVDNTNPTVTCPANVTVVCPGAVSIGTPTSADNCSVASVISNSLNTYPQGTTTVIWTVSDLGGRSATCAQTVTVTGGSGGFAQLVQRLASDGASGDGYGISVGTSGDYAVVGSYLDDNPSNSGSAYIIERGLGGSENWGERKRLVAQLPSTASDAAANDRFGESVAMDGDWAVIGAPEKNTARGAVYLYHRNQGGTNNWGIVSKLTAPVGDQADMDRFGSSVSISNDYVIVGAKNDDNGMISNQGAAYIYQRSGGPGTFAFALVTKRLASDGTFFDEYGTSVSISGDYAAVGSPKRDDIGTNSNNGTVYILHKNQGGPNVWGQLKKISASDAGMNDNFGTAVAISGQNILVGAPLHDEETGVATTDNGAAYVFQQNSGGANNWGQIAKLLASDRANTDNFGSAVAMHNLNALVGSKFDDDGGMNAGSAYIYDGASAWAQTKLLATSPVSAANDNFGNAVGIGSGGIIIGSFRDDVLSSSDQGSVYLFSAGCTSFTGGNVENREEDQEVKATLASNSDVRCFPNPISNLLNIDLILEQESEVNIVVTDAAGRIVSTVFSGVAAPEARYQWDVTQHPTGIYFVRVEGAGLRKVVPVSVIR